MVKQYLESGLTPVDTVILTATTPPDPSSGRPIENPDLWPTKSNVVSGLSRVIERGKPRDFVYIHFSGHGTRIEKPAGPKHPNTGELALVLFENNGCSYLRGEVLANALRQMVKKGLFVTLVLGCCFSGSAVRYSGNHGVGIRATEYDRAFDTERPQEHQESLSGITGTLRNAPVVSNWLVDPEGYAILSACGPHKKAWELEVEGGGRRGALTYFLIDALSTLRNKGVELAHQSLYQYLRTRFHASWPQQTPMRYGNGNSSFFGDFGAVLDTTLIPIYTTHDNRLCLSAGEAHGVRKGDEYAAYPFHEPESTLNQTRAAPVVVRVDTVRCLTSDLLEVVPGSAVKVIEAGWKAKPVTNLSLRKMTVRLMASVSNPNQWMETGKQQRFLRLSTENAKPEPCIFNLVLNENNEYELLDGYSKSVISLPTVPADTNGALNIIMDVLQHLAKFKYFEGVENRRPSLNFERSFSLLPLSENRAFGASDVKHGDVWGFTIENFSDRPLCLAVFDCAPSWQILNLVSVDGGGDFLVLPPKKEGNNGKQKIQLRMEVPKFLLDRGLTECEDIIKIFVTSKPTSFSSVILPEMPFQARDLRGRVGGTVDRLSNFVSELTAGHRGQDDAIQEECATRNFTICTAVGLKKSCNVAI